MHKLQSLYKLPNDWGDEINPSELKLNLNTTIDYLCSRIEKNIAIYPSIQNIYNAFNLCSFSNTKLVIFGQDPYHQDSVANGLAFAVNRGNKIPPSLKNIYKEIKNDIGFVINDSGNLDEWAKQGVLLLNSSLTVEESKPGSHSKIGWDNLINLVINKLNKKGNIVFLLWGEKAILKRKLIDEVMNHVLTAPHPSPLSSHRGFFGCSHFSKANKILLKNYNQGISW
jgi:uracil-DNA glycosylase